MLVWNTCFGTMPYEVTAGISLHSQHAEEKTAEYGLHAEDYRRETPQGIAQCYLDVERPEVETIPFVDQPKVQAQTCHDECRA